MKKNTMKYIGATMMIGLAAGMVTTAMTGNRKGIKGAKRNANKAVHAMGDLIDNVKYILS